MPNIAETEYYFTSSEGKTPIHVREWTPDCDLNGVVQISHGINAVSYTHLYMRPWALG